MNKLLEARRRYTRMLDALGRGHELGLRLREELKAAIAAIDARIDARFS